MAIYFENFQCYAENGFKRYRISRTAMIVRKDLISSRIEPKNCGLRGPRSEYRDRDYNEI